MKQFMVVLHGKPSDWNSIPSDQQQQLLGRYMAWVEELKSQDRFKAGSELHPSHRDLRSVNNRIVVDGPFPETKEVLTGYFVIKASSLDEAAEISKECPALSHGDWVQVYEMPSRE
jgi:hypothetical protein